MRYLVLAQSTPSALALGRTLELLGDEPIKDSDDPRVIKIPFLEGSAWSRCEAYESVACAIFKVIDERHLSIGSPTTVLVDSINPSEMSAISDSRPWDHLVGLLILSFPEIRWIFGLVARVSGEEFPWSDHNFAALMAKPARSPLFDPTGLREWVRERTNANLRESWSEHVKDSKEVLPMQLPARQPANLAVAIDEEEEYAALHAYTAYRYGYRAEIVTTWALMNDRFGIDRSSREDGHGYQLIFEDMRLAFPDKPPGKHLSRLGNTGFQPIRDENSHQRQTREQYCPLLSREKDRSRWRILVTTGQAGRDKALLAENEVFLHGKLHGMGRICLKPLGGICDVWTRTGLRDSSEHGETSRGNAPAFFWPPLLHHDAQYDGHGAPGKLAMVAKTLLARAEGLRGTATCAMDWIRAALLASEAAELLNGKTPTLSLTALALKHECEVRAECHFVGAGYHFGLKERFREIREEVDSVCRWFEGNPRQARLDASATIINRIKLVFAEVGQLEEEEACLVKLRWLNRMMSVPRGWKRWFPIPIPWLSWLVLFYGEFLLASFSRLVVMTAVNFAVVAGFAYEWGKKNQAFEPKLPEENFIAESVGWFFGAGASSEDGLFALSIFAVISGVFHLGILMSFLYSLVSRR